MRAALASHTQLRQLGASRTSFYPSVRYPSLKVRSSFAHPSLKVRCRNVG
ncbi:hypothetical protein [Capnocytophaga bilenii]